MKWLDEPHDEAERFLRESLDLAQQRVGDELLHRRVWAKVAETATQEPEPRRRYTWVWATAAATVLVAAGAVTYFHYGRGDGDLPSLPGNAVAVASKTSTSSAAGGPTQAQQTGSDNSDETDLTPEDSQRGPGHVVRAREGERVRVSLGGGAIAELEPNSAITWDNQHRPSIQKGTARLEVPHQPPGWRFSVTAGPYVVTVVGTKFEVHVSGRTVGVDVTEGVVEVWRNSHATRLVAGDSWDGPLYPDEPAATAASAGSSFGSPSAIPSERPQPATERPQPASSAASAPAATAKMAPSASARSLQDADSALRSGDAGRALEILSRTAQGTGPAAENAAYEMARITRYNLNRPRQAVALWDKYRTRFPAGLLRTETDLSIVETLAQMGETRAALAEADAFLSRHPSSERRHDVERLAERLRAAEAASQAK